MASYWQINGANRREHQRRDLPRKDFPKANLQKVRCPMADLLWVNLKNAGWEPPADRQNARLPSDQDIWDALTASGINIDHITQLIPSPRTHEFGLKFQAGTSERYKNRLVRIGNAFVYLGVSTHIYRMKLEEVPLGPTNEEIRKNLSDYLKSSHITGQVFGVRRETIIRSST